MISSPTATPPTTGTPQGAPQAITSAALSAPQTPSYPVPTTNNAPHDALGASLAAFGTKLQGLSDSLTQSSTAAPAASTTGNSRQSVLDTILGDTTTLGNKGADTAAANQTYGLDAKTQAVNNLANEYSSRGNYYDNLIKSRQQNLAGAFGGATQQDVDAITRNKNQELANIAIQQSAANGDLTTAQNLIKQTIDAKYQPVQDQIDNLTKYYQLSSADMTDSEKQQAQAAIQDKQSAADEQKAKDLADYNEQIKKSDPQYQADLTKTRLENTAASKAASAAANGNAVDLTSLSTDQQATLKSSGFTGYSADAQSLATQLVSGNLAPADLSKRSTGTASYNDVLTAADKYSMATTGKHFNISTANRDYKFATNTQTQNTLNFLKSLVGTDDGSGNLVGGNLDELKNASDAVNRTSFPALNDTAAWARLAAGDPAIASYQTVATEVSDQVAKILQGGSSGGTSDAKLQQAQALFEKGFSKAQLNAVIGSLKPLLLNRAKGMIGDNAYLSDYKSDLGLSTKAPSSGGTIVTAPDGTQVQITD
jgi:hypothetical protein